MSRHFKVAELAALAGILAGGYLLLAYSKAAAVPVAASEPRESPMARPAAPLASPQALAPTIASARAPVPLQVSRRATYWVEDPQPAAVAAADGAVPQQADKKVTSDAAAKAMIEADGYRNVRSLAKAPDGAWRGLAMRGTVEVAVSVDGNGSVSTQ